MSVNIYYRTIKKGKDLEEGAPSSFIQMFEGAFALPAVLTKENIEVLNGMRIGSEHHKETLEKIIEAIDTHGEIEVYAEY
jgi:hypothetical protein